MVFAVLLLIPGLRRMHLDKHDDVRRWPPIPIIQRSGVIVFALGCEKRELLISTPALAKQPELQQTDYYFRQQTSE